MYVCGGKELGGWPFFFKLKYDSVFFIYELKYDSNWEGCPIYENPMSGGKELGGLPFICELKYDSIFVFYYSVSACFSF